MLRIKRFISHHQKPPIHDSSRNSFENLRFEDTKLPTHPAKRLSWVSQSPLIEHATLGRTNSQATVRTYHNRTASATAHSSATSLCSCDCAFNPAPTELPLSREPATSNHPEILYLPPLSPSRASDDAQAWRLIFSESPSRSPASSISKSGQKGSPTATIAAGSTFDLIGALALETPDENKTPTQSLKYTYDSDMEYSSDNVEQLIRETDAAFQAVGNALADAKAATRGWYDDVPVARNTSLTRGILRKHPRSSIPPLKAEAPRPMSVAKKKKPAKPNLLGRTLRSVPPPPENTPSRWTLSDVTTNMVDVFSGKMFRTEVDEMLTPGRMQQLQESIRLSQERRESADSVRGTEGEDDIETPTEPFYLESLSSRLDAVQDAGSLFPSPVLPPPAIPKRHPNRPSRVQPRKVQFVDREAGMTVNDLTFPSPPRISRRPSASGSVPHLPTIPEVSPLTLSPAERFNSVPSVLQAPTSHQTSKDRGEENYIYLPCSPFTLTSPLFRHGTIRVPVLYREPNLKLNEEALDWTAFQMAISGTGGIDGYSNNHDREDRKRAELEEIEREVDDIMQWWAGFGYSGWGRMVGDDSLTSKRRRREHFLRRKRKEDIERAGALETRVSHGHSEYLKKIVDMEKIVVAAASRTGSADEAERRQSVAESLPPSPMLDLVVPNPSKDNEIIPMGFNLGHDLGDFLRWETNHVQTLFIHD